MLPHVVSYFFNHTPFHICKKLPHSFSVNDFTGKKDGWPTWSEKILARARQSGIKDLFLGKLEIPIAYEEINEKTEDRKNKLRIIDLNELAYT